MKKTEALKKLYKALGGGELPSGDTAAKIIDAIAEHVSGGGAAELPEVTAADDGKVLTVVDGEWVAAAPADTADNEPAG